QPRDTLEAFDIGEPDALARMQACGARVSAEALAQMRKRAYSPLVAELTATPGDTAVVVERGGVWVCLRLSPARFPLLPVDMLLETIAPGGAEPARSAA